MEYYRARIEEIAKRVCSDMHLAVYDIEEKMSGKGRIITVYLTKVGGVTIDECALFSRALGDDWKSWTLFQTAIFWKFPRQASSAPSSLRAIM